MKAKPYSELKKNARAYEIMLQHDGGKPFAELAKTYGVSVNWARQIYCRQKYMQIHLYLHRIAAATGQSGRALFDRLRQIEDCYRDGRYVCAYLEQEYSELLAAYHQGEPEMPEDFVKTLPPMRPELTEREIKQILKMHESGRLTFGQIGQKMGITSAKARHTYKWHYRAKAMEILSRLQEKLESEAEKEALWNRYFGTNMSSKRRYELLSQRLAEMERQKKENPEKTQEGGLLEAQAEEQGIPQAGGNLEAREERPAECERAKSARRNAGGEQEKGDGAKEAQA